jgi:hypothetical protein
MFEPWLRQSGVDRVATDVKVVWGWSDFITGRGDKRLTADLARMSSYATRTPEGDCIRLLPSQSRARGMFVKGREQLVCEARPGPSPASVGACETCGATLPSGVTRRRWFCDGACRIRRFRRRAVVRWVIRLPKARAASSMFPEREEHG